MQHRQYTTRSTNGRVAHPGQAVIVHWVEEGDGHGFEGKITHFEGGEKSPCGGHSVRLRMGSPLGSLHVALDEHQGGCYRTMSFEGTGIDLRDLQWATLWACLAVEMKHQDRRHGYERCRDVTTGGGDG